MRVKTLKPILKGKLCWVWRDIWRWM